MAVLLSNSSAPQGVLTLNIVKDCMFKEEARRKELGMPSEKETGEHGRKMNKKSTIVKKNRRKFIFKIGETSKK